ncbi:hydroxymethylglutaryl-CoA lyase [Halomonas urumqiensis]|uniref:Hydroxymethylglutaryl-CoA lyase n=1 Tax=Halomonas urumqiensis TaxID=1684789 RepID=A0A2N7UCZ3_9GAMM|nr:hydroxymethylglutaryl-CoA lyase [Halomonas urumqiensis]PMR78328.1 hydroxymethylglutaryl-CoA lyase [Halomonas urumqiensis]PTB03475.1 hydroxymethylglutaryl-CoA lyase [Halomonas urumqiensis]GHE20339.1 hydroxymethylglutaryl-CoA lyase [Halomonas urumqiensis]
MTSLNPPARVDVVEVAPRDGFQSIQAPLPTQDKQRCIQALVDAGVTRLEIGSFVSPRAIPQMADTGELVAAFAERPELRLSALVPNLKGAELALDHGIREVVYVVSVSEAHNRSNVRRGVDESLEDLGRVIARLRESEGTRLRLDLGTSFDCPFDGTVSWQQVDRVLDKALTLVGELPVEVAMCDTTGRASPYQVADHFTRLRERHARPGLEWAFHGHDTFGMGVANALFAIHHGATAVDTACAGLGGCPFAPGATGNTATEDLLYALQGGGVVTGIDLPRLLAAADLIADLPGGQTASHLRTVPRERVS